MLYLTTSQLKETPNMLYYQLGAVSCEGLLHEMLRVSDVTSTAWCDVSLVITSTEDNLTMELQLAACQATCCREGLICSLHHMSHLLRKYREV